VGGARIPVYVFRGAYFNTKKLKNPIIQRIIIK